MTHPHNLENSKKRSNFVHYIAIYKDMAFINHRHTYYIILLLFLFLPQTIMAQKKRAKKTTHSVTQMEWVPDPVARKAMPDRLPNAIDQPILAGYGNTSTMVHGIDVSHYQGRINWDEVAKDPKVNYVYLKATEGVNYIDDTYNFNFQSCKRVGLKVGSYLFFRPNLPAKAQFDLFVSQVDTKKQDLLPLIDAEVIKGVSISVFQTRLLELCELLEKEYGKKPIIYTGRNFYNKHIYSNSRLRSYKFFIASYSFDEPELYGGDDYQMWQYSASGRVRGIRGDVDMSRLVGRTTMRDIMY